MRGVAAVWGWGILSVAIISLSGIFGGLLWPVLNSRYYATVIRFLIGLAAGSLTSTSIFQLIPEVRLRQALSEPRDHQSVSVVTVAHPHPSLVAEPQPDPGGQPEPPGHGSHHALQHLVPVLRRDGLQDLLQCGPA